jgi:hypothetical protein
MRSCNTQKKTSQEKSSLYQFIPQDLLQALNNKRDWEIKRGKKTVVMHYKSIDTRAQTYTLGNTPDHFKENSCFKEH